jgi:Fe-S oxidoreductase
MAEPKNLPLLRPHDAALQKCVYCPKLCRATCPVSNVEANESVIPWGKMSLAWFSLRGDVPLDGDHAEVAWACTLCHACRDRCEHDNDVAAVLTEARAEYFAAGIAPLGAQQAAADFAAEEDAYRAAIDRIDRDNRQSARTVLVIGEGYALHSFADAEAIWWVAQHFVDGEIRAVRSACAVTLLQAGDRAGLLAAAHRLRDEVGDAELVLAADPTAARALMVDYPRLAVAPQPVVPLLDLVYAELDRIPAGALGDRGFRYHDPCALGRGLGRYEEPRAILARVAGVAPRELERSRHMAECSGGCGLLPRTRPETARAIGAQRIASHRSAGGGRLVTACADSLRHFRACGEEAVDLMSLVAEACGGPARAH